MNISYIRSEQILKDLIDSSDNHKICSTDILKEYTNALKILLKASHLYISEIESQIRTITENIRKIEDSISQLQSQNEKNDEEIRSIDKEFQQKREKEVLFSYRIEKMENEINHLSKELKKDLTSNRFCDNNGNRKE